MLSGSGSTGNVAQRLTEAARRDPDGVAIAEPCKRKGQNRRRYRQVSFRELDADTDRIAAGLRQMGVGPGMRLVLMVRPGIDFIALVFALFKAGAVIVLVDPGMGRKSLIECLEESEPEGFVALPVVHALRRSVRRRFRNARYNVTVGRRWFWRGPTLRQLRQTSGGQSGLPPIGPADPAAIIFTTGSTGPPKGVLYRHRNFNKQVDEIRDFYTIEPGEVDLPGFPLFGLFNAAMGVTTVVPDMDFSRPAEVDPRNIVEAAEDWKATQTFASPAVWNAVGRYCETNGVKLPTVRRVLSAGAPVPPHVLQRIKRAISDQGEVHTPYGATEALPVASIAATEVLGETAQQSASGSGTCVGQRFPGIQWKVIRIDDGPIEQIDQAEELPPGEIGELIVRGAVVTDQYVTRVEENAMHKIHDSEGRWHRMGDVGYLDFRGRFWFCGRKSHRLLTTSGPMYPVPCEAIIDQHHGVYRSALVGVGPAGYQIPVIVVETWPEQRPNSERAEKQLLAELWDIVKSHALTSQVRAVLLHPSLPVDIRHNAKIFREQLAEWAAQQLKK